MNVSLFPLEELFKRKLDHLLWWIKEVVVEEAFVSALITHLIYNSSGAS